MPLDPPIRTGRQMTTCLNRMIQPLVFAKVPYRESCEEVRCPWRRHLLHGLKPSVVVLAALFGLTGCGSPSGTSPSSGHSATPSSNAANGAILQAYRAGSAAFVAAVQIADPAYPALAATTTNPLLTQARQTLVYDKEQGIVGRGTVQLLHPHVVSYTAAMAVVQDCVYSSLISVYASSGQPVPNQPGGTQPEYDGVKATLIFASGVWKVSDQTLIAGSCPAGY
jgi:hypothetical protein